MGVGMCLLGQLLRVSASCAPCLLFLPLCMQLLVQKEQPLPCVPLALLEHQPLFALCPTRHLTPLHILPGLGSVLQHDTSWYNDHNKDSMECTW
jgi:hypothetical protein